MLKQKQPGGRAGEKPASRRRRRNYGYRGYGSGFGRGTAGYGGHVHWGRGFSGVGFPGDSGGLRLPRADLFAEELSERGPYTGLESAEDSGADRESEGGETSQ